MQYPYWTSFLKCNFLLLPLYWAAQLNRGVFDLYVSCRCWCFKFFSQPPKNVQLSVTFISSQNDWTLFLIIIGLVMGFLSERITLNHFHNTLFIWLILAHSCLSLEIVLHIFTWCHKQLYLALLFHYITVDDAVLYEAVTTLWLSSISSLGITSCFWGIFKGTCFLLPQNVVYSSLNVVKPL